MKCPVCFERFTTPIYQCVNGHSVCAKCKSKLTHCPSCKGVYLGTRNYDLESVIARTIFPCSNTDAGCIENLSGDNLKNHEKSCIYRRYECTLCQLWDGRSFELRRHFKETHPGNYYENKSLSFWYTVKKDVPVTEFLVWAFREAFLCKQAVRNGMVYWIVRFLGDYSNACKFSYEIHVKMKSSPNKNFRMSEICSDDLTCDEDIIKKGLCIAMLTSTYQTYKDVENKVHWDINIYTK